VGGRHRVGGGGSGRTAPEIVGGLGGRHVGGQAGLRVGEGSAKAASSWWMSPWSP
jgi:hypothetical protein